MKPYYEHAGITIYHGDCREVLPTLIPVDLVLTDPPYGNNFISAGKREKTKSGRSACISEYGITSIIGNIQRVDIGPVILAGKNQIIWGGNYYADVLKPVASWLIWDKRVNPEFYGMLTFADCELAWCSDGAPARIHRQIWNGLIREGDPDSQRGRQHPTQKPVKLMSWCIARFPNTETILDPFMGSGTTLRAAKNSGCRAIGIEIEEKYCEIAARRMEQEVLFGQSEGESTMTRKRVTLSGDLFATLEPPPKSMPGGYADGDALQVADREKVLDSAIDLLHKAAAVKADPPPVMAKAEKLIKKNTRKKKSNDIPSNGGILPTEQATQTAEDMPHRAAGTDTGPGQAVARPSQSSPHPPIGGTSFDTAAIEKREDDSLITNKQWCNILNAGFCTGKTFDNIDDIIRKKFGGRVRDLKRAQYDAAVAAVRE